MNSPDTAVQEGVSTMTSPTTRSAVAKSATTPQPIKALHLGSGDPVLLLHGFMLSPHCWEQVAVRLSSNCEGFAPAFAGHWGGDVVHGGSSDVPPLADRTKDKLDELVWRPCHIAGNSLGAWVGFELA